jgi:hypothetical protein
MKTVIFSHFNVIEIIFALNNALGRKDNTRIAFRGFKMHRHGQGPPVPSARTTLQEQRLVKYFQLPQTDQRSDAHSSTKPRNIAPSSDLKRELWRRQDPCSYVDPRRTRHDPLHHHQPLHLHHHHPPTIVIILIAIVDLYSNSFHSFNFFHKIMMIFLIVSMCE